MSVGFTLRVSKDIDRKSSNSVRTYVLAPHKPGIEKETATESLNLKSKVASYPNSTVMSSRVRSINYVFRQPSTISIVNSLVTYSKKEEKVWLAVIVTV